jgi:hypothetical protein
MQRRHQLNDCDSALGCHAADSLFPPSSLAVLQQCCFVAVITENMCVRRQRIAFMNGTIKRASKTRCGAVKKE